MNVFNFNKGLAIKQQHFRRNKKYFLRPNFVPCFMVPIDIHIIECIIHVETLVNTGAQHVLVMKILFKKNTLNYYGSQT
jgi:hypothetical protein